MTDFSAKIQAFITKVENAISQKGGDVGERNKIDTEKEISLFYAAYREGDFTEDEFNSVTDTFRHEDTSVSGRANARRKANGEGGEGGGGIVINIDASTEININIRIDADLKALVKELMQGNNAKLDEIIKLLEESNQQTEFLTQIVLALFDAYKTDHEALMEKLGELAGKVENGNQIMDRMYEVLLKILDKQLALYNEVKGWDISNLLKQIKEGQDNQTQKIEEQTQILQDIYAAIQKLGNDQKDMFNVLMAKFNAGEVKFDEVIALLKAIKDDTSEGNKTAKDILAKADEILQAIKQMGINLETIHNDIKGLIVQLVAQGQDLEDIKKLLIAMGKDIQKGNEINQENLETNKLILEAIKELGTETSANFKAILDAINNLPQGQQGDYRAMLEELLKAIKENTAAVDNNTKVSEQNKKEIIAAIEKLGVGMSAGFKAILDAINNGNKDLSAQLAQILKAIGKNTKAIEDLDLNTQNKLTLIFNKIGEVGEQIPDYTNLLTAILGKLDDLDKWDEVLEYLDDILQAIKDHDVHVTVDVTGEVTCNCGGDVNEGIKRSLSKAFGPHYSEGDDPDSVNAPNVDGNKSKVFYDMQGRVVQNPRKGEIYIVDGKKVVY